MQIFLPPQCVDEIMEDMPERDLLPKNVMKVPEVFHYTVKPPNRGHFGDGPFVPCREVVLFSEVLF